MTIIVYTRLPIFIPLIDRAWSLDCNIIFSLFNSHLDVLYNTSSQRMVTLLCSLCILIILYYCFEIDSSTFLLCCPHLPLYPYLCDRYPCIFRNDILLDYVHHKRCRTTPNVWDRRLLPAFRKAISFMK